MTHHQQTSPPLSLRVGFIGVDSNNAFNFAADPQSSTVAVVFSAVEQLRRYFENNPRSMCQAWVAFFHELGAANVKDAEEEGEDDAINNSNDQSSRSQQQPQQGKQKPARTHARNLISRKVTMLSDDAERLISGRDIVSSQLHQLIGDEGMRLVQKRARQREKKQKLRQRHHPYQRQSSAANTRHLASSSATGNNSTIDDDEDEDEYFDDDKDDSLADDYLDSPLFWLDMTTPPCRLHIDVCLPVPARAAAASSLGASSSFTEVIEVPALAQWRVAKVLRRVAEKTGVHAHNLEAIAALPPEKLYAQLGDIPHGAVHDHMQRSHNDGGVLMARQRPLLDILKLSREVQLRVVLAEAPVCSVKVVEAAVAERACEVMYARANVKNTHLQAQHDSSRLSFHDASFGGQYQDQNYFSNSSFQQQQNQHKFQHTDAYGPGGDPFSIVEAGSKRMLTMRHLHWASTLEEVHKECHAVLAPALRGRGFLCLEPAIIQTWPRESVSFNNTGGIVLDDGDDTIIGSGNVPVFSPDMTLRQVARLCVERRAARGGGAATASSAVAVSTAANAVRLYIVVNSRADGPRPKPFKAKPFSRDNPALLAEADDARRNLMHAVFPASVQLEAMNGSRFKKQNVDASFQYRIAEEQRQTLQQQHHHHHRQQQTTARQVTFSDDFNSSSSAADMMYNNNNNNDDDSSFYAPREDYPPQPVLGSFGLVTPPRPSSSHHRGGARVSPRRPPAQQHHQQHDHHSFAVASSPASPTMSVAASGDGFPRGPPPAPASPSRDDSSRNVSPVRASALGSPDHTEGTEAFVAVPTSSNGGGGSEVIRLLLPDGYFALRRLKRFLKLQAEQGAAGALSPKESSSSYKVYFGPTLLTNDDDDIKRWVNPSTKLVFLNATSGA